MQMRIIDATAKNEFLKAGINLHTETFISNGFKLHFVKLIATVYLPYFLYIAQQLVEIV